MFVNLMRFISIFMLLGFAIFYIVDYIPAADHYIILALLFFLLFSVGYIITHYVKRIFVMLKSMSEH